VLLLSMEEERWFYFSSENKRLESFVEDKDI
jgi:hypothetical protein